MTAISNIFIGLYVTLVSVSSIQSQFNKNYQYFDERFLYDENDVEHDESHQDLIQTYVSNDNDEEKNSEITINDAESFISDTNESKFRPIESKPEYSFENDFNMEINSKESSSEKNINYHYDLESLSNQYDEYQEPSFETTESKLLYEDDNENPIHFKGLNPSGLHQADEDSAEIQFFKNSVKQTSLEQKTSNIEKTHPIVLNLNKKHSLKVFQQLLKIYVHKIHNKRPFDAAHDFDLSCDQILLSHIIEAAYSDAECQASKTVIQGNVIEFLTYLDNISDLRTGFYELLKIIERYGDQLTTSQICVLPKRIKGAMEGIDTGSLKIEEVQELDSRIKSEIQKLNGKCEDPAFVDQVRNNYDRNKLNFRKTLTFILSSKTPKNINDGLIQLLEEMEQCKHVDNKEYIELLYNIRKHFTKQNLSTDILQKSSSRIQDLVWKGDHISVWLQNKATLEYLHYSNHKNMLNVITCILNQTDSYTNWFLVPKDPGKVFHIQNVRTSEFLCLVNSKSNHTTMQTEKNFIHCEWIINPVMNGRYIQFNSRSTNQILLTTNTHQHLVYTIPDEEQSKVDIDNTFWKFELKNDTERIHSLYKAGQENIDVAIQYLNSLPIEDVVQHAVALLDKIKQNQQIDTTGTVQAAYLVKQRSSDLILPSGFPDVIRDLIWKGSDTNTWIKNVRQNKYLYPEIDVDPKQVNLVDSDIINSYGSWRIFPNFFGRSFRIHNKNLDLDLCMNKAKDQFAPKLKLVQRIGTKDDKKCNWKIKPASKGQYIQIENESTHEMLHSNYSLQEEDEAQCKVFTNKMASLRQEELNQTYWTLESFSDVERVLVIFNNSLANFNRVLTFIESLTSSEDMIESAKVLHENMLKDHLQDSPEYVQLAYFVKIVIKKNDTKEILKKKFPNVMQDVVWNGDHDNVWLKNQGNNEYFVQLSNTNLSTMSINETNSNGNWLFIPLNEGHEFRLHNSRHNQDLCLLNDTSSKIKTETIVDALIEDNCKWNLVTLDDGRHIQIQNKVSAEVLCVANGNNVGSRIVQTIKFNALDDSNRDHTLWTVDVKDDPARIREIYMSSGRNFERTMKYVKSYLPEVKEKLTEAVVTMLEVLMSQNQSDTTKLIELAYFTKAFINDGTLKQKFPSQIQELIWKSNFINTWIKNKAFIEYLAGASEDFVTTVPKNHVNSLANWYLNPLDEGKVFLVHNSRVNKSLCLSNSTTTTNNVIIQPTSVEDNCQWILVPSENLQYIQFQSKLSDDVLCAAEEKMNKSRFVSTIKLNDLNKSNINRTLWRIDSKNEEERINLIYNATSSNFDNALRYVASYLPEKYEETAEAVTILFNVLSSHHHLDTIALIQLAYFTKISFRSSQLGISLKQTFPEQIQELIWNGDHVNTWLQSKDSDTFLTGRLVFQYDDKNGQQNVLMTNINAIDSFANWIFVPLNGAKTFRIYNSRLQEDLCLHVSIKNQILEHKTINMPSNGSISIETKRTTRMNVENDAVKSFPEECHWIIVPAYNGTYINFKPKMVDVTPYVKIDQSKDIEEVVTIRGEMLIKLSHVYWHLICKNDSERILSLYNQSSDFFVRPLNFIESLPNYLNKTEGAFVLYQEIMRLNHIDTPAMIWLTYLLKKIIEENASNDQKLLKLIESELPTLLKELIFKGNNENCWIKSKHFNEYLYVAEHFDATKRSVFLWMSGDMGIDGNMLFKPNNSIKAFSVFSDQYKGRLYSITDPNNGGDKKSLYLWLDGTCGDQCNWEILPTENATYLQIRSKTEGSYIYADESYFEGSRSIYTSLTAEHNATERNKTLWSIECRSNIERVQSIYNKNVKNLEKALTYIRSLINKTYIEEGLRSLIDEMQVLGHFDTPEFIQLSIAVKRGTEKDGWNTSLKKMFPTIIQDIIWTMTDSKCWLINKVDSKILYADFKNDTGRLVLASNHTMTDIANWHFSLVDKINTFRIKNKKFDENLYTNNPKNVQTTSHSSCKTNCEWELIPAENAQFIQIKSKSHHEYLYLQSENIVSTLNVSDRAETLWKIDCKTDSARLQFMYNQSLSNFDVVMDYLKSLGKSEDIIAGVTTIINEMIRSNQSNTKEIIQLAHFIQNKTKPNLNHILKPIFPKIVQHLVWANPEKSCWLKHNSTQKYLRASHNPNNKGIRVNHMVTPDSIDSFGNWMLVIHEHGKFFYIQNSRLNESLKTSEDHSVITLKPEPINTSYEWEIIPVDADHIQIKHYHQKRFLVVMELGSAISEERKHTITTALPESVLEDQTMWTLDCQNNSERITSIFNKNATNLNRILNFINSLPDYNQKIAGIFAAVDSIKQNKHMDTQEFIQLASVSKQIMANTKINEALINSYPHLIKQLIWVEPEKKCWIANKATKEYLYATGITIENQSIFTMIDGDMDARGNWLLDLIDQSSGFKIRNLRFMNDLELADSFVKLDQSNKCVSKECFWDIQPVQNAQYFQIKSKHNKQVLVATDPMGKSRRSVVMLAKDFNKDNSFWSLDCKTNEERVKLLYSKNLTNFDRTLVFIRELYLNHEILNATFEFFMMMKTYNHIDTNELIRLAYFSKLHMNNGTFNETLSNAFPPIVKDLIWKGDTLQCRLHNKVVKDFLYAAHYEHDPRRRYVFPWMPGDSDLQCEWQMIPKNEAREFGVRNVHFKEYLGAFSGKKVDQYRRATFTWIPGDYDNQCAWVITPAENATWFQIKHLHLKDYLYADESHNDDRHTIFTWPTESVKKVKDKVLWRLECR